MQMLSDVSYDAIRRDIIACHLPPGIEVTEARLCERYGMGKAPVRAALVRLTQDGLVRALPRRGHVIAPISLRDVDELYQIRMMIEPAIARLVAPRFAALPGRLALAGVQMRLDGSESLQDGLLINREFHMTLARMAGNRRLEATLERLLDDADRFIHLWMAGNDDIQAGMIEEEDDHHAILAALQAGDPDAADAAMYRHLGGAHAAIMGAITSRQSNHDLIIAAPAGHS